MNNTVSIIIKEGDTFTVSYTEIPTNDPLFLQLIEKYSNSGCSLTGSKADVLEDLNDNL